MALVSELVTEVTVDNKSFLKGMAAVAAAGAAAATAVVYAVDSMTDRIDKLGKSAQKLGIDFEAFQGLRYAADIANVPLEKLEAGMVRLAKNVDDAASGNKEAAETFKRLGLSASELQKMGLDEQYLAVANSISGVTNKNEQLALSLKAFGKSGTDNLLLIREDVNGLVGEFQGLGLTITEAQRAQSEAFQDTKTKMEAIFGGFADLVAADVAPAFTILMDELTMSITGTGDLKAAARDMASGIVKSIGYIVDGFDIFLTVLDKVIDRLNQIKVGYTGLYKGLRETTSQLFSGEGISKALSTGFDSRITGSMGTKESSLGGNLSGVQGRLSDLSKSLSEPLLESFIQPITKAGDAIEKFSKSTEKASSQIDSMIKENMAGQAADRINQLLKGSQSFNDTRQVYQDAGFESRYKDVFEAIAKQQISVDEFNKAIQYLTARASVDGHGVFNAMPNIAAVQDLKKYGAEQGLVGTPKQKAELKVFVKADKGFITEFADQPQFGDAVGKWLEIITEASN